MKLASISHYVCDDYDTTTYVMIPDDMSIDTFGELVNHFSNFYLKRYREWKALNPTNGYVDLESIGKANFDKTYSELLVIKKQQESERNEYYKKQNEAKGWFEDLLKPYGIKSLYDCTGDEQNVNCYWGHNHGMGGVNHDEHESNQQFNPARKLDLD